MLDVIVGHGPRRGPPHRRRHRHGVLARRHRSTSSPATARRWVRVARALDELPHLRARFAAAELSWDQIAAATRSPRPTPTSSSPDELLGLHRRPDRGDGPRAQEAHSSRRPALARRAPPPLAQGPRPRRLPLPRLPPRRRGRDRQRHPRAPRRPGSAATPRPACGRRSRSAAPTRSSTCAGRTHQVDPGPEPALVVVHVDADVLDGIVEGNGPPPTASRSRSTPCTASCATARSSSTSTVPTAPASASVARTATRPAGCVAASTAAIGATAASRAADARSVRSTTSTGGSATPAPRTHGTWLGSAGQHHHLVHEGGWTIKGNADQELTFTSPRGRVLTARPPPLLPETRQRIHDITGLDLGRPDDR